MSLFGAYLADHNELLPSVLTVYTLLTRCLCIAMMQESRQLKYKKGCADPKEPHALEKPITGPDMGGKISESITFT